MNYPQQQLLITNDQIVAPLVEILQEITPKPEDKPKSTGISTSLRQTLDDLFPEQQYDEKNIQKAKEILGSLAKEFTPEQLQDVVSEIQYLTESWLDEFERKIFSGLTLRELLHEKGGL